MIHAGSGKNEREPLLLPHSISLHFVPKAPMFFSPLRHAHDRFYRHQRFHLGLHRFQKFREFVAAF